MTGLNGESSTTGCEGDASSAPIAALHSGDCCRASRSWRRYSCWPGPPIENSTGIATRVATDAPSISSGT